MTEKECLAAGIAVSLFAHFALLIAPRPPEPEPSFTTVVQMDMASPAVATSREKGIGIAAASPRDMDKADAADRKRQAFLRYLDDIDEAVHARRLDGGETGLIGVAEYMFTVRPDGTFTDPVLRASSGSPQLDASARRAVLAASGKVRRPAIIGTEPIPVYTNTASADRATARQSSRIARRGQGGVDGVMPFSGALQRGCFSLSLSLSLSSFLRHHLFRFLHAPLDAPVGHWRASWDLENILLFLT